MQNTFTSREINCSESVGLVDGDYQLVRSTWSGGAFSLPPTATHFGIALAGKCRLNCDSGDFTLSAGMYFSVPGAVRLSGEGQACIVSQEDYQGFFHLGGPVEAAGRLQYIDGCTDSLLIAPVACGDPCLNLLCLPPHTQQTSHTHPSVRIGVVVTGRGICRTQDGEFCLEPGQVWTIARNDRHSFHTAEDELRIVAFHPDSDFGPTNQDHPMINRTEIATR